MNNEKNLCKSFSSETELGKIHQKIILIQNTSVFKKTKIQNLFKFKQFQIQNTCTFKIHFKCKIHFTIFNLLCFNLPNLDAYENLYKSRRILHQRRKIVLKFFKGFILYLHI